MKTGYSLPANAGTNFLQPPQQLTIAARKVVGPTEPRCCRVVTALHEGSDGILA